MSSPQSKHSDQPLAHAISGPDKPLLHCMQPVVDQLRQRASTADVGVSVDMPEQIHWHDQSTPWARIIEPLIELVIAQTPAGGEVSIIAHQRDEFVEIEIADGNEHPLQANDADDGTPPNESITRDDEGRIISIPMRLQRVSRLLGRFGGRLEMANCPQGGVAWTICLPRSTASILLTARKAG